MNCIYSFAVYRVHMMLLMSKMVCILCMPQVGSLNMCLFWDIGGFVVTSCQNCQKTQKLSRRIGFQDRSIRFQVSAGFVAILESNRHWVSVTFRSPPVKFNTFHVSDDFPLKYSIKLNYVPERYKILIFMTFCKYFNEIQKIRSQTTFLLQNTPKIGFTAKYPPHFLWRKLATQKFN